MKQDQLAARVEELERFTKMMWLVILQYAPQQEKPKPVFTKVMRHRMKRHLLGLQ